MTYSGMFIKEENTVMLSLIKVVKNDEHAVILYGLLKQRRHTISHKSLPTFEEHKQFVLAHPYRVWYLIKADDAYIGSIYAYKNNGIGISLSYGREAYIRPTIELFLKHNKPLKPIKSVRSAEFGVYSAPTDKRLIATLKSMGAHFAQVTYLFDNEAS